MFSRDYARLQLQKCLEGKDLYEVSDNTGVSYSTLCGYLRGRRFPNRRTLLKLAKHLNKPEQWFFNPLFKEIEVTT